jgi:hypothetical protein
MVEVNTHVSAGDELLSIVVLQAGDRPPCSIINSLSGHNLGPRENRTQPTLTTVTPAGAASSLEAWSWA